MPSVSRKQHNFMAAVAHSPEFAKKAGLSQIVGKHFIAADKAEHKYAAGGAVLSALRRILSREAPQAAEEWVGQSFYRGVPRLADSDVKSVSGLKMAERGGRTAQSLFVRANTGSGVWISDNPFVAGSYTHGGGAMIPLELTERPGAMFDAGGRSWHDFYFPEGDPRRLRGEFAEAMRDPSVRSLLVRNVVDTGTHAPAIEALARREYGLSSDDLDRLFMGNNMLLKEPGAVRYRTTKEPANFARGGLAQLKECTCHG